ncbi:MAG TPA: DUF6491 family protein [Caulobacteraceae bacterium]|jgi:hypothetical protein
MSRLPVLLALAGSALLLGAAAPASDAPKPARSACFLSTDWQGWKPSADSRTIYIHVNVRDYYRLDLSSACTRLQDPTAHLVTHSQSPWICNAIDLDLKVADENGFAIPCIVRKITPMTRAEVDALPKKQRP